MLNKARLATKTMVLFCANGSTLELHLLESGSPRIILKQEKASKWWLHVLPLTFNIRTDWVGGSEMRYQVAIVKMVSRSKKV